MITAEQYPVEVGKVALLKSNNRLVYVSGYATSLKVGSQDADPKRVWVSFEHDGKFCREIVLTDELETPEARMIEEARYQKFVFDLTAQVNESAKTQRGPELVQ